MDVLQSIEEMGQVHVPFRLKMKFGFEVCNGMKHFRCGGHFVEILLVQVCTQNKRDMQERSCTLRKARGIFRLQTSDFRLRTSDFRL